MKDPTDPLQYRGISLLSIPYKVFAKILNHRLSQWLEDKNIMSEEQNGLRSGRGTLETVGNITTVVETRNKLGTDSFAAFIDFRKAYDFIQHILLCKKTSNVWCPRGVVEITAMYVQ